MGHTSLPPAPYRNHISPCQWRKILRLSRSRGAILGSWAVARLTSNLPSRPRHWACQQGTVRTHRRALIHLWVLRQAHPPGAGPPSPISSSSAITAVSPSQWQRVQGSIHAPPLGHSPCTQGGQGAARWKGRYVLVRQDRQAPGCCARVYVEMPDG